jgi:hypothetical protein
MSSSGEAFFWRAAADRSPLLATEDEDEDGPGVVLVAEEGSKECSRADANRAYCCSCSRTTADADEATGDEAATGAARVSIFKPQKKRKSFEFA